VVAPVAFVCSAAGYIRVERPTRRKDMIMTESVRHRGTYRRGEDMRIDETPESLAAFQRIAADPRFTVTLE